MIPLTSNTLISLQTSLAIGLRAVGRCIMECRHSGTTIGHWEGTQYKALADQEADSRMRKELQQILDIKIISEEDIPSQVINRPNMYWLVDPIDGTASFAHGFDGFVCQAALIQNGLPTLAGVYAPALNKLFLAIRGNGANLNGQSITVRSLDRNHDAPILVDNTPQPSGITAFVHSRFSSSQYIESGSIGLKICLIAQGIADIFIKDVVVKDWDLAAPQLILQEAGGILTELSGAAIKYQGSFSKQGILIATNSYLHDYVQLFAREYSSSNPIEV